MRDGEGGGGDIFQENIRSDYLCSLLPPFYLLYSRSFNILKIVFIVTERNLVTCDKLRILCSPLSTDSGNYSTSLKINL